MRERKDWLTEGNTAQRIASLWGHMALGYLVVLATAAIFSMIFAYLAQ